MSSSQKKGVRKIDFLAFLSLFSHKKMSKIDKFIDFIPPFLVTKFIEGFFIEFMLIKQCFSAYIDNKKFIDFIDKKVKKMFQLFWEFWNFYPSVFYRKMRKDKIPIEQNPTSFDKSIMKLWNYAQKKGVQKVCKKWPKMCTFYKKNVENR